MKIGDKIYCIDDTVNDYYDDYNDDYIKYCKDNNYDHEYYYNNNYYEDEVLLSKNKTYTIEKIYLEFSDFHSEWVAETSDTNNCEYKAYFQITEINDLLFNQHRFLSHNKHRKLKIQNIDESR